MRGRWTAAALVLGAAVAVAVFPAGAAAKPGDLDPAFFGQGKTTSPNFGAANALAVQADGKLLAFGGTAVTRINPDGTPDPGFGMAPADPTLDFEGRASP